MKRYEAIEAICQLLTEDDAVISSVGLISRELFVIKDSPQNFYMVGSMGLTSSIGLGLAFCRSDKRVIIIEGDGSILMNMGSMATIGHVSPHNLLHIILDNEAYDSSGAQPTASVTTKLEEVARATRYRFIKRVNSKHELQESIHQSYNRGPAFILVKIELGGRRDLPRVLQLEKVKTSFQEWLKGSATGRVGLDSSRHNSPRE